MELAHEASDDKGRPYYLLSMPLEPAAPDSTEAQISINGSPMYEIPPPEVSARNADIQLSFIKDYERRERFPQKVARKIVDWALSGPGTLASGAAVAYEAYVNEWSGSGGMRWIGTVGCGIGGLMGHDLLRRPVVGARSLYHSWRNPWTPAAQSNERIRREILEL